MTTAPETGDDMAEFFDQWPELAGSPARTCAWCEKRHPEHVSIEWTHGDRLYFCTDTCHREWAEHG